ncbi:MAG: WG repeat-containing protein [Chitinophaga sp.]|uniref:WG repeat-containing protein n=1 Tax=Chitinophaga sp. TaxID=1869181 RepID=UPI0025BEC382|nr:WG repeat-containing protein [Chitinophaga sp.]MBV8256010.1 WG repeat-containing protein [Chitinophaga sp.]
MKKTAFPIWPLFGAILLLLQACDAGLQHHSHSNGQPRFVIQENYKQGYINERGEMVIAARFVVAQDFSEGLAAVRENGYYGYIDESGRPVIEAKFDYATPFSEGLAFVYKGDTGQYIDRSGIMVIAGFSNGGPFHNGKAIVESRFNHTGMIDLSGKLLLDTVYQHIALLNHGLILTKKEDEGWVLSDSTGLTHTVMNRVSEIESPSNGYMVAWLKVPDSMGNDNILLDSSAQEIFRYNSNILSTQELLDGKIILRHRDSIGHNSRYLFDLHSKKILLRGIDYNPTTFSNNRSIMTVNDNIVLMKGNGEVIPTKFNGFKDNGFQYGYAFVREGGKYGMIDTMGKYLIQPQYENILQYGMTANYFFFTQQDTLGNEKFGMADRKGKIILPAVLEAVDVGGFINGLLRCTKDSLLTYINEQGKIIWQAKNNQHLFPLNIDYKLEAYCYVEEDTTNQIKFRYAPRTYHPLPRPIQHRSTYVANALQIQIDTTTIVPFENLYKGYKVRIINNTDSTIQFNAQDYRLYMSMQAYINNKWQNLEYFPQSWCGNSYMQIPLNAGNYWELTCPVYEGSQRVKLRFSLLYVNGKDVEGEVFSQEFSGSINPAQRWRNMPHFRSNIMDPYN